MATRTAYRTCPLCEATCGLEITLENESVKVIRGDRQNPFSHGFICPKGSTLGRLHDDPDRLRTPMIRRDGRHEAATWDEAFSLVADRLGAIIEKDGRDAVAMYVGNPNAHLFANSLAIRPLAKTLGTKNVFSASTVDQMPKHVSSASMFGSASTIAVPDIDRTDVLVILGANPYESNGSLATAPDWPGRIEAVKERGGTVVVVDPRRTKTAANASRHLAIKPGTDAALLVGIIHRIIAEGRVRLRNVDGMVSGLDELTAAVEGFELEAVARFTGVPVADIEWLADTICNAERAVVYGRIGTHTVTFGTLSSWAVDVINTISGNLDREGGAMFPLGAHLSEERASRGFRTGRWHSRVRGLPEVVGELPVATMADEIETPGEGQVRALITIGGNPALTTPDADRLDRALDTLDFMVSVDPYLNETTRHADVILPPPSALEKSHYDLAFTTLSVRDYAMYSPPVFELDDDSMTEFDILVKLTGIAAGMGADADPGALGEATLVNQVTAAVQDPDSPIAGRDPSEIIDMLYDGPLPERFLDFMLRTGHRGDHFGAKPDGLTLARLAAEAHGVDFGPLQPRFPGRLATPSGMVELAPPNIIDDLPRLRASIDGEHTNGLRLVSRRELRSNNSWLHNIDVLVKGKMRCTLQIHPDDAAAAGLEPGDTATVSSAVGSVDVVVDVTDEIMAGVVCLPYGWGHDREGTRLSVASRRPGVNTNILTDSRPIDPLSGNAVLNGIPVTVTATS